MAPLLHCLKSTSPRSYPFYQMFPGESLPQVKSPLDINDHPELDNSDLANDDLITKFMCMIGQLQ